tara:strand:- start:815 stop:1570 length:756 start_codon:yes stop_codon:yes gene_type:complete
MANYIKKYINRHRGKRAIVCGTGPSLNDINFNLLSDDIIIFACNQSVTALDKCDYFCIADNAIICMDFFEHGAEIANEVIVMGPFNNAEDLMSNNHDSKQRSKFVELIKNKSKFFPRGSMLPFNKTGPILKGPPGEDVVHITSHFAYLLGCREIILAGVDLTIDNGIYCESTIYKEEVRWDGIAHYNNNDLLSNSFNVWQQIKESSNDVKFLNASPRGRLNEIFDSIPIESLYTVNLDHQKKANPTFLYRQ